MTCLFNFQLSVTYLTYIPLSKSNTGTIDMLLYCLFYWFCLVTEIKSSVYLCLFRPNQCGRLCSAANEGCRSVKSSRTFYSIVIIALSCWEYQSLTVLTQKCSPTKKTNSKELLAAYWDFPPLSVVKYKMLCYFCTTPLSICTSYH